MIFFILAHMISVYSSSKCHVLLNLLTPNVNYSGLTAPLTSKVAFYIFIQQIGTEYFEHGIHSPFFSLQNAVCFIILTHLVPVLFTFYIQVVLKFKKNNSGAKRLKLPFFIHKIFTFYIRGVLKFKCPAPGPKG